jgi:hypothetical protein
VQIYGTETDKDVKNSALGNQNNAEGLVGIAKGNGARSEDGDRRETFRHGAEIEGRGRLPDGNHQVVTGS